MGDKQTMAGHGGPLRPSDYEIGVRQAQAEGAYRYNQAADLGLNRTSGGRRGSAPKRRPSKRGPSKRPPSKGYKKTRTYRPKNPVQRTRQISKRTAYDDYAPIRRGRYY